MTKLKYLLLLNLGLTAVLAQAQAQVPAADPQANAANRELAQRGGKISPRQQAELTKAAAAETSQKTGGDFLASNKAKPGVITLASGVQYKVLKAGSGTKPTQASSIHCRYQGTLNDGKSFDKVEDKNPAAMRVSGFPAGLQQALKLMPAGSKWEVVIPPNLGYGAHGEHAVGPNAVLIYTIELLDVI